MNWRPWKSTIKIRGKCPHDFEGNFENSLTNLSLYIIVKKLAFFSVVGNVLIVTKLWE